MRATSCLAFALAFQIGISAMANAANAPAAGPQASAEQIRAAHPAPAAATRIVFEEQRTGAPATVTTVIVADDFLDITRGGRQTIYDFKLKRVIAPDANARRFSSNSLYAGVAFRAFERRNRSALGTVLGRATLPDAMKPFWIESQLGVIDQAQTRPEIELQRAADGTMAFRFEGAEVVRLVPSAEIIPDTERSRFARAMRYLVQIHPSVLDQILATGLVPRTLSYVSAAGATKTNVTLTLKSVDRLDAAFPLPLDFAPEILPSDPADSLAAALNGVAPQMVQAVARQYGAGPRSVPDYHSMIGDAINARGIFQAVLLEFELMLHHGQDAVSCNNAPAAPRCYSLREVAEAAKGDTRAQAFLQALQIEPQDRNRAIELRQGIARGDLKEVAALDIMLANALSPGPKHGEALPLFLNAIRANPYVASFYKDLGDHFLRDYRMDLAWLCFDLGRMLPDADATGNFQAIDRLEQQLAQQNSSSF